MKGCSVEVRVRTLNVETMGKGERAGVTKEDAREEDFKSIRNKWLQTDHYKQLKQLFTLYSNKITSVSLLTLGCSKSLNPYLVHSNCRNVGKTHLERKRVRERSHLIQSCIVQENYSSVQWGCTAVLSLLPHSQVLGNILLVCWGLSECNLHVLPVALQISWRSSNFLPQLKNMHLRLTGYG